MSQKTPLYALHQTLGAKLVDFGGWDMPLHYGSQIEEHHAVRNHAGLFDVSHMTIIDVSGSGAKAYLQTMLANDVARLTHLGKALYSGLLNEQGGVIDDLIVYWLGGCEYRVVVNASTREKDWQWLQSHTQRFDVQLTLRSDLAMIAIQGPQAISTAQTLMPEHAACIESFRPFYGQASRQWFIARTGYTGEDGLEIMLPPQDAIDFWQRAVVSGVASCGLGARDTLRLEAGMNLYGQDMNEAISPLEANMGWTIAWEPPTRDFIGRRALESLRAQGVKRELVGLLLEERGVLRAHQRVGIEGVGEGEITSGTFSPTLNCAIALARVPISNATHCQVDIRGKYYKARMVKPPFVRHGKAAYS